MIASRMSYCSDESTFVNSDSSTGNITPSVVPRNDYLWFSMSGEAFTGWQHQLVLHVLAVDNTWNRSSGYDFSTIKLWLQAKYPNFSVTNEVLDTIAAEFLNLDDQTKFAYERLYPKLSLLGHDTDPRSSLMDASSLNLHQQDLADELFDSALFQQSELEVVADRDRAEDAAAFQTTVKQTLRLSASPNMTEHKSNKVPQGVDEGTLNHKKANEDFTSLKGHQTRKRSYLSEEDDLRPASEFQLSTMLPTYPVPKNTRPTTPDQPLRVLETPGAPRKKRLKSVASRSSDVQSLQGTSSLTEPIRSNHMETYACVSDGVVITEENAKLYAPLYLTALARYSCGQEGQDQSTDTNNIGNYPVQSHCLVQGAGNDVQASGTPFDKHLTPLGLKTKSSCTIANGIEIATIRPKIRPPNPEKYVQTSRNHWKIPESEAESFVEWWRSNDTLPDKIEGYFWYCDRCYRFETANARQNSAKSVANGAKRGKYTRGKFSGKRSVEKHYQDVHKQIWAPVLPELERMTGRPVEKPHHFAPHADAGLQHSQTNILERDDNREAQMFECAYSPE